MQVPEKLALIGGSILLSSTLIFTLKSQTSRILPEISDASNKIFDNIENVHRDDNFDGEYQEAQKRHWQTGQWGTAPWYIDEGMNLHIGSGQLQDPLEDTVGHDKFQHLKTINLDGHDRAPEDSSDLFGFYKGAGYNYTSQINGLGNLDTSNATNMSWMFGCDASLTSLDVSHFDTSHATDMHAMFDNNESLTNLDLSNFDTSHVINMGSMFYFDKGLNDLNLGHFDTSHVTDRNNTLDVFYNDNIGTITLGPDAKLSGNTALANNYRQGNQTLHYLQDSKSHPGTWTKQ